MLWTARFTIIIIGNCTLFLLNGAFSSLGGDNILWFVQDAESACCQCNVYSGGLWKVELFYFFSTFLFLANVLIFLIFCETTNLELR